SGRRRRGEVRAVRVRVFSCRASLLSALSASRVAGAGDFRPRAETASRGALGVFQFLGRLEAFSSVAVTRRPEASVPRHTARITADNISARALSKTRAPRATANSLDSKASEVRRVRDGRSFAEMRNRAGPTPFRR